MDKWDGWTDVWWIDGMDACRHANGWMDGWVDVWVEWMQACMDRKTDVMDGW